MTSTQLRLAQAGVTAVEAANQWLRVALGIDGAQLRLDGYDGLIRAISASSGVLAGATTSSNNPSLWVRNTAGKHVQVRNAANSADIFTAYDTGIGFGPDLTTDGNLIWKSGTAFKVTLDHAATADRVITVPDATDTLALLGRAQTFSATNTFSSAAPIVLSALVARLTGPFGDATRGNRPFFQASANNNDTNVNAMPSGSNTIAKWEAYNNSTPGSATGIASLEANSTEVRLSAAFASGTGLPLQLWVSGGKSLELLTTGEVRATKKILPTASTDDGYGAGSPSVAAGASQTLGSGYGLLIVSDPATGATCLVHLLLNTGTATTIYNSSAATLNVGADAGTTWAIFHNGSAWAIKNRTASARTVRYHIFTNGAL